MQANFLSIKESHPNSFIYTDGSGTDTSTTFAISTETSIMRFGRLTYYSSIFSAEIIDINEALEIIINTPGKFTICSDSLSSLDAISNTNNRDYYPTYIKSLLTQHKNKKKLLWVP